MYNLFDHYLAGGAGGGVPPGAPGGGGGGGVAAGIASGCGLPWWQVLQVTTFIVSGLAEPLKLKYCAFIPAVILNMWRAMSFSGLSSLAKSGQRWVVSFERAWQKSQRTPSDFDQKCITFCKLSFEISFGRTCRFLKPCCLASGLCAAMLTATHAAINRNTVIFFLLSFSMGDEWLDR